MVVLNPAVDGLEAGGGVGRVLAGGCEEVVGGGSGCWGSCWVVVRGASGCGSREGARLLGLGFRAEEDLGGWVDWIEVGAKVKGVDDVVQVELWLDVAISRSEVSKEGAAGVMEAGQDMGGHMGGKLGLSIGEGQ